MAVVSMERFHTRKLRNQTGVVFSAVYGCSDLRAQKSGDYPNESFEHGLYLCNILCLGSALRFVLKLPKNDVFDHIGQLSLNQYFPKLIFAFSNPVGLKIGASLQRFLSLYSPGPTLRFSAVVL